MAPWALVVVALPVAAACGSAETAGSGGAGWVGTVATEGDVTTVVNESGSVWGGDASTVEELSIGVEAGAEPYMFGNLVGIDVAPDGRIFVADGQGSAVRAYDAQGKHLRDIGGPGQGPGEFTGIRRIAVDPGGRLIVQDRDRVAVFDLEGNVFDTWPHPAAGARQLSIRDDGVAYVSTRWSEGEERVAGIVAVAPDGSEIERIHATPPPPDRGEWGLFAGRGDRGRGGNVPYSRSMVWSMLPSGSRVEGYNDRYRFEIRRPGGETIVVERAVDLPPVPPEEAAWLTRGLTAWLREIDPEWEWTVNPIPSHKRAFEAFFGDRQGRLWVVRTLRTDVSTDCPEDPFLNERPPQCWTSVFGLEAFDEESGRYLGGAEVPAMDLARVPPAFLQDKVVTAVQDDSGTIIVKRYQMVLPGAEER